MVFERNYTVNRGEERIVSAAAYIDAGMYPGAALPDDYSARSYSLTAKAFDSQALGFAIAAATCAAASFFMSH
jgi:hypothetical protein